MLEPRICKNPKCGKQFIPNAHNQYYCCEQCIRVVYNTVYKKVWLPKVCLICGAEFTPTSRGQKTCGREECKHRYVALYGRSHKCKYDVPNEPYKPKPKMSNARWNKLSPGERWKRMSLMELDAECFKFGMDYGDSQSAYYNGTLPLEFGKRG